MKFDKNDVVKHVKTNKHYRIVGTPDEYRLEATNEPAYAYQSSEGEPFNHPIWVRSKAEMEDGRFVLA